MWFEAPESMFHNAARSFSAPEELSAIKQTFEASKLSISSEFAGCAVSEAAAAAGGCPLRREPLVAPFVYF